MITTLLGWSVLPLTIAAVAYRFLVRHDPEYSFLLVGILGLSVFISSIAYQYARATLRADRIGSRWLVPIILTTVTLYGSYYVTVHGTQGDLWRTTAILRQEELSRADLRYRNLRNADLMDANLREAKLLYADLTGANMSGADVHGADLRGATGLTVSALKNAKNWQMAVYSEPLRKILGLSEHHNKSLHGSRSSENVLEQTARTK